MVKQTVMYPYRGLYLPSNKEKQSTDTHINVDESKELCWVRKEANPKGLHIAFLKWQNQKNGRQISVC